MREKRIFCACEAFQLIFETMLNSSRTSGQQIVIQHYFRMLFTFLIASRPSSLGNTHKKWEDHECVSFRISPLRLTVIQYIKIENLQVYVRGYMKWAIEVHLTNLK